VGGARQSKCNAHLNGVAVVDDFDVAAIGDKRWVAPPRLQGPRDVFATCGVLAPSDDQHLLCPWFRDWQPAAVSAGNVFVRAIKAVWRARIVVGTQLRAATADSRDRLLPISAFLWILMGDCLEPVRHFQGTLAASTPSQSSPARTADQGLPPACT
jgi:hypothetical protein